jgi:hypothetical protein
MAVRQVVVDGSNLATEGRSLPSLAQLDEAVRDFMAENADANVIVVVDASFGHRIDPSEVAAFEAAEEAGEVVSPPAGAIGRGDAFLLRIAQKIDATVLSNDSFQEFHGEHDWLFTEGRLVGGKPVPGVGWIFTPRTPVRGPKSREAVKEAKRRKARDEPAAEPVKSALPGIDAAAVKSKGKGRGRAKVDQAIASATEEAVEPDGKGKKRRRRKSTGAPPAEPVNEPLVFINFVAAHPLGSDVEAEVDSFSSHGAFVVVDGARCYVPLSALGDPAPRAAREVLTKGENKGFVVQALDPPRRGIELALPEFAKISGAPTEETVEAEIEDDEAARKAAARKAAAKKAAVTRAAKKAAADEPVAKPAKKATKKATAVTKKKKASAKKAATPAKKATKTAKKTSAVASKKKAAATKKSSRAS